MRYPTVGNEKLFITCFVGEVRKIVFVIDLIHTHVNVILDLLYWIWDMGLVAVPFVLDLLLYGFPLFLYVLYKYIVIIITLKERFMYKLVLYFLCIRNPGQIKLCWLSVILSFCRSFPSEKKNIYI